MPPPKRPKSEVVWTTLCTGAESRVQERSCYNVDDSLHAVSDDGMLESHNAQHVNDAVAMLNDDPSTPHPNMVVSAVSCESPLDLRRTDVGDRLDTGDVTGSRRATSATTLRRLLLEPVTPSSDLYRATTSPASAAHSACQRTVVKQGRTNVCTQPIAAPSTAARTLKTDIASSRNLPSAVLRRILLTVDDHNDSNGSRPQPSVTTGFPQSNDSLFVRLATTGSGLDRSASSAASAVVRALPHQQSFSASDNRYVSQTTLSLSSKYAVLTGRLECRELVVSGEESKFTEEQRKASSSLKDKSAATDAFLYPSVETSRRQSSDESPVDVTRESHESPSSTVDERSSDYTNGNGLQYHCQVCEDAASGFHYGVWSCEGCKAFFKRSLQGPSDYVCPATNNCTIDKLRRRSCQACRLRKCYKAGMSVGNCRKETQNGKQRCTKRKLGPGDHVSSTDALKNMTAEIISKTDEKSQQQSTVNERSDSACSGLVVPPPQYLLDDNMPVAEQRQRACRLAEYLQLKTTLQTPAGVEIGLNSEQCSQKTPTVLLMTTLKLIGNSLDGVITWAKAIPGFSSFELSSRIRLLVSGWPDILVLDTAWRSLSTSNAVIICPGFTVTRDVSEVMGCVSLYAQMLAIVQTFKHLQLTFNELMLLRCEALLNADASVLCKDVEVRRLRSSLEVAWQLLFDNGSSHYQRCMKFLLTLTHVRQCGLELTSWLTAVKETENISTCDTLLEMLNSEHCDIAPFCDKWRC